MIRSMGNNDDNKGNDTYTSCALLILYPHENESQARQCSTTCLPRFGDILNVCRQGKKIVSRRPDSIMWFVAKVQCGNFMRRPTAKDGAVTRPRTTWERFWRRRPDYIALSVFDAFSHFGGTLCSDK